MKLVEILVWTGNIWKGVHTDTTLLTPLQDPSLSAQSILQQPPSTHSLLTSDTSTINNNDNAQQPPTCTFSDPLPDQTPIVLPSGTWTFVAALLSHRIQELHAEGASVTHTIDVKEELMEYLEDAMDFDVGWEDLYVGLVYSGRDGGEEEEVDDGVKPCVDSAIRDVYDSRKSSGWMSLGNGGFGEESGEWVSYVIYQEAW